MTPTRRPARWSAVLGRCALAVGAAFGPPGWVGAAPSLLAPWGEPGSEPPAPWKPVGLPQQRQPMTRFTQVELDGRRALRVEANDAYGNLVHPFAWAGPTLQLAWSWRVDRLIEGADLRSKKGDDVALKVCVLFDLSLDRVPFVERQLLRLARRRTGEDLPAATVCYVWDAQLPAGTPLDNAYTRRVRYLVLQSGSAGPNEWRLERRDVAADFIALFGDESRQMPPVIAVAVGADTDNTHGHGIGHLGALALEP